MKFKLLNSGRADSEIEILRYEQRARQILNQDVTNKLFFDVNVDPIVNESKDFYENTISKLINSNSVVLEIGAGTGDYSGRLVECGAKVTLLDTSPSALEISRIKFGNAAEYVCGNMEKLPFRDSHFDFVLSAGSLSYGEYEIVRNEILRVLRPTGTILILDSLNENPIYRLNRFRHFLLGRRTRSTLKRIPTKKTIKDLISFFESSSISFFGRHIFLYYAARKFFGPQTALRVIKCAEKVFPNNYLSFKFVLVATRKN